MSNIDPSYEVTSESIQIGETTYQINTLKNLRQYFDPHGVAEKIGISSASWPLFGVLWQSSVILANLIDTSSVSDIKILEVGCGIGLPSIVAAQKGANITVSDYHPLAETFLNKNAELNNLPRIKYVHGDWRKPITQFGKFDLIIGSDLLYERQHPEQLSAFIDSHASPQARVIIIDPGRKLINRFSRIMNDNGYHTSSEKVLTQSVLGKAYKGKVHTYQNYH